MVRGRVVGIFWVLGLFLALTWSAYGEQDTKSGGTPAVVRLDFQVNVQTVLQLRIGTAGPTIDTITFTVSSFPGTPVSGSPASVTVRVRGQIPATETMTLSADSSGGIVGPATIPFDEISCDATDDFSDYTFDGTGSQTLDTFGSSGTYDGTYSFTYDNDTPYPAGTYNGQVTYTLSSA